MIKAVLFDVGGTLLDPFPSVGDIYSSVAKVFGVSAIPAELNARFKELWASKKKSDRDIDSQWWKGLVREVFEPHPCAADEKFLHAVYEIFRDPLVWRVYPDVLETLTILRHAGLRLAILSNWDDRLPSLLDALGIAPYFEQQFISYKFKLAKPDRRFFQYALANLNVSSNEVVHVGDDSVEDLKGAEDAGIRAYLLDRRSKKILPNQLRALQDLTKHLSL